MSKNATVLRAASCSLQLEPTYYDPRAGEALYLIVFKGFGWIWLDANIQEKIENATVLRGASCSLELEATWCEARPRDRQGRRNFVFFCI